MATTEQLSAIVGERVRHRRVARSWTLDQLADASHVSRRMLINIEQGVANPSIGVLLKLGDALGVGLPALVEPGEPTAWTVTRRGAGPVLWSSTEGGRAVLVASSEPPDVIELWDWTLGPGDRYASDAHGAGTRELLQVQDGAVGVEAGEQEVNLEAGDALSFRGDVPHAYLNVGVAPARFVLSVFEPAVGSTHRNGTSHA